MLPPAVHPELVERQTAAQKTRRRSCGWASPARQQQDQTSTRRSSAWKPMAAKGGPARGCCACR